MKTNTRSMMVSPFGDRKPSPRPDQNAATQSKAMREGGWLLAREKIQRAFSTSKGPLRVLIVDDETRAGDADVRALVRQGMIVRKTGNADALLKTVRRFRPDVVVMDDHFKKAGFRFSALTPSLRDHFPGVRIVVRSDRPEQDLPYSDNPRNWGAADVIYKPEMLTNNALGVSIVNALRD